MIQKRFIQQSFFYVLLVISLVAYVLLGYFTTRTAFCQLITLFAILFTAYGLILKYDILTDQLNICIGAAILFRLFMLFMVPNLSDDYFRFIWDGRLLVHGINPYSILPRTFINTQEALNAGLDKTLFTGLNSPDYYTVYPPMAQLIFAIAAKLSHKNILGSIIVMRLFLILAEVGTIYLIIKLLEEFHLPRKYVLLYACNPLVIIELSGNLHFEAITIFWLLLSLYLLIKSHFVLSAICFAFAVGTKLIPLIFLPFLIKRLGLRASLVYYLIIGVTTAILFIPFLNKQLFPNIFSSVELYFQQFEFNAGIYRLIHWVGYEMIGCNSDAYSSITLSVITFFSIAILACLENAADLVSLFKTMLLAVVIYYLLATTIHPWYLATAVMFSVFVSYRFVIIWSALIPLSYIAYQTSPHQENLQIIALEYLIVMSYATYEFFTCKRINEGYFSINEKQKST